MKLGSLDQRFAVETIAAARGVPAAIAFELVAETQEVAMDKAYMEDEASLPQRAQRPLATRSAWRWRKKRSRASFLAASR